jgi:DNA-binding MarR family transcriptional regulator
MGVDYAGSILQSLRRIIRSIDQHNKQLGSKYGLTVPQLVCLRQLLQEGVMTLGRLAKAVYLSQATVTGIIDRLYEKGLISRERSTEDRRKMKVRLTEEGIRMVRDMPWPLQERFSNSLAALPETEQDQIDQTLKKLVQMMEAPPLPVWPFGAGDVIGADQIKAPE